MAVMLSLIIYINTAPSPIKPVPIYIADDNSRLAQALRKELTKSWEDRINPRIEKTPEALEYCKKLDERVANLKKYFRFEFAETRYSLAIKIGDYGRWQNLPETEWLEYPTEWLKFFEYVRDEYFYDDTVDKWFAIINNWVCDESGCTHIDLAKPYRPVCPVSGWSLK